MADINRTLRDAWIKGVQTLGNKAGDLAENARTKVNEMNLEDRRKQLMTSFGEVAYQLFKSGEQFPEACMERLREIADIDGKLEALRAEHQEEKQPKEEKVPTLTVDATEEIPTSVPEPAEHKMEAPTMGTVDYSQADEK